MSGPLGVLAMAYGTASGPDDIARYYTDIRGGRPPSPELLEQLRERYAAIGNRFPLLDITRRQAEGLVQELNATRSDGQPEFRAYLGMKHSPPFITEGVAEMRRDGIERAVGIVMAPHWSAMSVEGYVERAQAAASENGGPSFTFVRGWHDHPLFVEFLAARVDSARQSLGREEREGAAVVFSAHSLPTREVPDGTKRCRLCLACQETGCRYVRGLEETAGLVAHRLGLEFVAIAWQSAGRTADPWWGPPVGDVIQRLAAEGHPAVIVCSAGFVADHLEILYDLDIEAREIAKEAGIAFVRTEMPNVDPGFLRALAAVVGDHLRQEQAA
jgi:protoporphyrin/coproporphyrin ferrochelatase